MRWRAGTSIPVRDSPVWPVSAPPAGGIPPAIVLLWVSYVCRLKVDFPEVGLLFRDQMSPHGFLPAKTRLLLTMPRTTLINPHTKVIIDAQPGISLSRHMSTTKPSVRTLKHPSRIYCSFKFRFIFSGLQALARQRTSSGVIGRSIGIRDVIRRIWT